MEEKLGEGEIDENGEGIPPYQNGGQRPGNALRFEEGITGQDPTQAPSDQN